MIHSEPRVVAIVSARMASSRYPGKALVPLAGRPLLQVLLERIASSPELDSVALATSVDGQRWERRGIVLPATTDDEPDTCAVTAPCVVRLRDGSLRMWYSRRPWGDDRLAYAIGSAVFPGPWPGHG